jgi:hypothetical protein
MEQIVNKPDYAQSAWLETYEDENVKVPVVFMDELYSDENGLDFTGNVTVVMQHPGRGTVCFTMSYEKDKWVLTDEVFVGEQVANWCSDRIIAKKS